MNKRVIYTASAPAPIGPYVQAREAGGFLFISGQLGIEPLTGTLPDSVSDQTRNSLHNISAILREADLGLDAVVKTTIFLTDMNDFAAVNSIYAEVFTDEPPARSCVAVKSLPKGASVEIECIAVR